MTITKVAVIGSGVMGSGIAAQLANAGLEVELLDIVPKTGTDRDAVAKGAIERMTKTKPAPLMHPKNASRIRPGNTEDHMARIAECQLIIEVVPENPAIKSAVFKKIDQFRKPGTIVASNTSTMPLKDLIADQSDALKKDFVITHFFNPPRYMQLLELITSEYNDPTMVAEITRFMDEKMGKGVIPCNDTPGFIGNRIGTFWLQTAINEAYNKKLTVEEADAIMGRPIGVPKTGVFGLIDLVGLDLMPYISKSLIAKLPAKDRYVAGNKTYPVIDKMIADGYTGRKGKGGFYRLDANKNKLAIDLETGAERSSIKVKMKAAENAKTGLRALVETKDRGGDYAWSVLKQTLLYSIEHAHEITNNLVNVDDAMKLGYGWKQGPFEMLDKLGVDYFISRLKQEGDAIPDFLQKAAGKSFYRTHEGKLQFLKKNGSYENIKRPEGVLLLSDIKRASKPVADYTKSFPVFGKMGAALWNIGDGVLCLEFTSKQNSLDLYTMKALNKACDLIESGKYKALVIHNEGENFSLGANIGVAKLAAKIRQFWVIDKMVTMGQKAMKRLKYAKFPVVSAPAGLALGGGCEVLMHSNHVQAHAETYAGLVEVGVGLLPAWGGSTEMLTRAFQDKKTPGGPMPPVARVFESISTGKVATSAFEAKDLLILRKTDGVTMNKTRLLGDAKAKALEMVATLKPEQPYDMELPGASGMAALGMAVDGFYLRGMATPYDVVVSDRVAHVLTGGDAADIGVKISQDYLRELERKNFMALAHDKRTLARIDYMLSKNKPLREKPISGKKAAELREEAKRTSFFRRIFLKFNGAANDNKGVTKDPKPKSNWPKV